MTEVVNRLRNNAFVFCCVLVVVALPFSIINTSRAMVLLGLAWLFETNFARLINTLKTNKFFWLFSSTYLLLILSLLYTKNDGLWELEKGIGIFLFPLFFSSIRPLPIERTHLIVKMFVVSNIVFGIISLVYATYIYFDQGTNLFFYWDLVALLESHPTYYSIYIIFCQVAVLFFFCNSRQKTLWVVILMISATVLFTILIYLLSVRSVILMYTFVSIVSILVYTIKTNNLKWGILFLIVFTSFFFMVLKINSTLRSKLYEIVMNHNYEMSEKTMEGYNGLTTRLAQWEVSIPIIKRNLLFGVAPADVQDELQEGYKANYLKYCYANKWNAHNQYIQTTLGLGLVGLFVFLANILIPGYVALKQGNILYLSFLFLFAFCSVTESTLVVQKGIVFFSFFQSLFFFRSLDINSSKNVD